MKNYDFLVRETLQRDRIYRIKANSEEEANNLLDGFKQEPEEFTPSNENLDVLDYDVLEVLLPDDD